MVKIIKCLGHEFSLPTKHGVILRMEWKCSHCGLVVHTLAAAQELQGKES